MILDSLEEIRNNYDTFIFDVWGVVHDGNSPNIAIVDFINSSNSIILSNAPRSRIEICIDLEKCGVKISPDRVFSSGMIAEYILKESVCYLIGGSKLNINVSQDFDKVDTLLITKYVDDLADAEEVFDQLEELISLPAVCPNPDISVLIGKNIRYCAGFFANVFEEFGGKVRYIGKPYVEVFNFLASNIRIGKSIMIGDTIGTDIVGAKNFGIDSCLYLSGNSSYLSDLSHINLVKEKPTFFLKKDYLSGV